MIPVLIAEDEKRIREGLIGTVHWDEMGYEVVGSAANGLDALELARRLKPQLLITDIRMPKMDGLQLLKEVRALMPRIKVLILSGYDDFSYAREVIKYGGSDYLVKPVSDEELGEALQRIRSVIREEEETGLPQALRSKADADEQTAGSHRLIQQVENYVTANYRRDLSIMEVAGHVHLSSNYFSHLFKKMRGASFTDYLNGVRVAKACKLLETSDLKVYEIAEEVGFTDYKYFSTVFRKLTGKPPTQYRPEAENNS